MDEHTKKLISYAAKFTGWCFTRFAATGTHSSGVAHSKASRTSQSHSRRLCRCASDESGCRKDACRRSVATVDRGAAASHQLGVESPQDGFHGRGDYMALKWHSAGYPGRLYGRPVTKSSVDGVSRGDAGTQSTELLVTGLP